MLEFLFGIHAMWNPISAAYAALPLCFGMAALAGLRLWQAKPLPTPDRYFRYFAVVGYFAFSVGYGALAWVIAFHERRLAAWSATSVETAGEMPKLDGGWIILAACLFTSLLVGVVHGLARQKLKAATGWLVTTCAALVVMLGTIQLVTVEGGPAFGQSLAWFVCLLAIVAYVAVYAYTWWMPRRSRRSDAGARIHRIA